MTDYTEILHNGQVYSLGEWARLTDIKYATLHARLRRGWSVKAALARPVKPGRGPRKHGMCGKREYRTWQSIRERCLGSRSKSRRYARYGGRGIGVCKRWNDFQKFYEDVGPAPTPNHSLGRINNNGDYSPRNCRWETPMAQANNRRTSVFIKFRGQSRTIAEWARTFSVPYSRFRTRLVKHGGANTVALKKVMNEWRAS